jgi:hypothetical protein
MLALECVYVNGVNRSAALFRGVKAPTNDELTQLTHTIAQRVVRFLERKDCWSGMASIAIWQRDQGKRV